MTELFLKDIKSHQIVDWNQLIHDLKNIKSYNPYCKSNNIYEVFKCIILSMLLGEEIILLDSDFTNEELIKLTGNSNYSKYNKSIENINLFFEHKTDMVNLLRQTSNNWKITLFTSGTTGIPKKVVHDFNSITRFVKYSKTNANAVWGFAYNPTHIAGVQVFLQALLNGNSIVNLFGLSPSEIFREIKENNITHISATPTFYRLLLPSSKVFPSVQRITTGGERFSEQVINQLKTIFPNAKITNIYALTEAGTLFASENDVFIVKPEYENFIKIDNGILFIHHSLMGDTNTDIGEWYNTGDLVEIIETHPLKFRFIARKTEMINVGGYKVNPIEVEDAILSMPEVKEVRVYPKKNSVLGNIVCCDIVCENNQTIKESTIRNYLQTKLQEFKIPRIIRFVEEVQKTRTGKTKRK